MSWIWFVLGALLVVGVLSVLVAFFVWRPRARNAVASATEAIAQELHGRPPLLIAPAQCRAADVRDGDSLKGLGVLALTEQAVLFALGERVVILVREGMEVEASGTSLDITAKTPPGTIKLTMPDTSQWAAHLTV